MAVKSKSIRKKAVAKSACMRRSRAKKRAYRAAQYLLQRRAQSRGFVKENDQITIPGTKEKTTLKPYNYQPVKLPVSKDPFEEVCACLCRLKLDFRILLLFTVLPLLTLGIHTFYRTVLKSSVSRKVMSLFSKETSILHDIAAAKLRNPNESSTSFM